MTPNSDRIAFLRAIADQPEDDTPRLVFADWLQEQGEEARAEFIRVQCAIARQEADNPSHLSRLRDHEWALLTEHESSWRATLPNAGGFSWGSYRRGFITDVMVSDAIVFAEFAERIFRATPVHSLTLATRLDHLAVERLAQQSHLAQITELRLVGPAPRSRRVIERLLETPHLNNLRLLSLRSQRLQDETVQLLANLPRMSQLTVLDLSDNELGPTSAEALARSSYLSSLRELTLFRNRIGDDGLRELVRSPHLCQIERLEVQNNAIHEDGVEALAWSDWLGRLDQLNLSYNYLGDRAARALAECRLTAGLHTLVLRSNRIGDPGAVALAESPYLGMLRSLEIGSNRIGDVGRRALHARFGNRVHC